MKPHFLIAALLATTASAAAQAAPVVTSAVGANAASISSAVADFRTSLGALNPNLAGSFGAGRREINWDGVPNALAAPNGLPANFFNVNSPRGVVLSTPGTGFAVSANAGSGTAVEFGNLDPTYTTTFDTFSPQRLFTALGSNLTDVTFFVPGSDDPASTSAFGVIFTDVDVQGSTRMDFFGVGGTSLGSFGVPALTGSETLSFLGVRFNAGERIGRVRITAGNAALGGAVDGVGIDLVAMDDFIYAEPVGATPVGKVSLPGSVVLMGSGLLLALAMRGRAAAPAAAGAGPHER